MEKEIAQKIFNIRKQIELAEETAKKLPAKKVQQHARARIDDIKEKMEELELKYREANEKKNEIPEDIDDSLVQQLDDEERQYEKEILLFQTEKEKMICLLRNKKQEEMQKLIESIDMYSRLEPEEAAENSSICTKEKEVFEKVLEVTEKQKEVINAIEELVESVFERATAP